MASLQKFEQDLVTSIFMSNGKKMEKQEQNFLIESQLRLLNVCKYIGQNKPPSFDTSK
jgi:hypothetical protein